jgi:hypothetical protein
MARRRGYGRRTVFRISLEEANDGDLPETRGQQTALTKLIPSKHPNISLHGSFLRPDEPDQVDGGRSGESL